VGIGGTVGRARECGREFPFSKLKYKKIMHFPILSTFELSCHSYLISVGAPVPCVPTTEQLLPMLLPSALRTKRSALKTKRKKPP
jgi:hypothetical protein